MRYLLLLILASCDQSSHQKYVNDAKGECFKSGGIYYVYGYSSCVYKNPALEEK